MEHGVAMEEGRGPKRGPCANEGCKDPQTSGGQWSWLPPATELAGFDLREDRIGSTCPMHPSGGAGYCPRPDLMGQRQLHLLVPRRLTIGAEGALPPSNLSATTAAPPPPRPLQSLSPPPSSPSGRPRLRHRHRRHPLHRPRRGLLPLPLRPHFPLPPGIQGTYCHHRHCCHRLCCHLQPPLR